MKWLYIIVLTLLALLCIFVWRGCSNDQKIVSDANVKARINDSLKQVLKTRDSVDQIQFMQLKIHDSIRTKTIDSLKHILSLQKDSLRTTRTSLRTLSARVQDLVNQTGDTTLEHAYDSLQDELEIAYKLIQDYSHSNDTTIMILGKELTYKDSVITSLHIEIIDLKKNLTDCLQNFDGLKKDTDKLERKVKNRTFLSRIGITVAAILGTVLILKQ